MNNWIPENIARNPSETHITIAMSGGVDSSVTALLVKEAGFSCSGLFMKNWNEVDGNDGCRWEEDVEDALNVCETLDIPLNTIDLSKEYWENVFTLFLNEYARGRTPNPDVLCNREIKFKAFVDQARLLSADLVATGHYVNSRFDGKKLTLLKGLDHSKDQSYFLHSLTQNQLSSAVFPVGGLTKAEVRQLAKKSGISTHDKKDSTGICFIGETHFRKFLNRFLPLKKGPIMDLGGREIGEHHGAVYYTLGQRKGLGIGGVKNAGEDPWFVVGKDVAKNIIFAAQGADNPALLEKQLYTAGVSWISGEAPKFPFDCSAKIRYRQVDQVCTVSDSTNNELKVTFRDEQRSITPGQSIVFYDEDQCLGGGVISRT